MLLPLPIGQFFQIHGSKFKLHPICHLGQASVLCITHRVLYLFFVLALALICRCLEDLGIPSPGGKDKWSKTTVTSILQNEKYKGDALLQKSFTVDFLEKRMKPNEGEVPQYYVEGSHPAIVEPDEWDHVQTEFARRKALGRAYSGKSVLSAKLVCEDCNRFFGAFHRPLPPHHLAMQQQVQG